MAVATAACSSGLGSDDGTSPATTTPPSTTIGESVPATVPEPEPEYPLPVAATATITGAEEMVFDWSENPCGPEIRPDLPTATYRDADGTINLVLSSDVNHRLTGPDFDSLTPDCDPVRYSAEDPDPGRYRFREWIGALYTDDGTTIHAVVHNEYHGDDAALADSQRDFSLTGDPGDWSYLASGSAGTRVLEPVDGEWRVDGTLCGVARWGAHPDVGCDPVRRWTVPEDGTYTVRMVVADLGVGGGDGVDLRVARGDEELWSATLADGAADRAVHELEITMRQGDQIDFSVSARGDASFDATAFEIEINDGPRPCTLDDRNSCQMMALTSAVSIDGGASFTSPGPNEHLIAAVPQTYEPDVGQVGIWQPSNIVRHPDDGYFYMFAQLDVHEGARNITGLCLLRTDDLSTPSSWRAWDGEDFDHEFVDPYAADPVEREPCPSVVDSPGWSLTYNTHLEQFVLLTETGRLDPAGVYFRTSGDLIHWGPPTLLIEWRVGFATGFATPFEAYPSLVDPDSEELSFTTVGRTAYLYHSRINGYDPLDFDLVRVPVRFDLDD